MVVWKRDGWINMGTEMLTRLLLLMTTPPLLQIPVTVISVSTALFSSIVQVNSRLVPVYRRLVGSPLMLTIGAGTGVNAIVKPT